MEKASSCLATLLASGQEVCVEDQTVSIDQDDDKRVTVLRSVKSVDVNEERKAGQRSEWLMAVKEPHSPMPCTSNHLPV